MLKFENIIEDLDLIEREQYSSMLKQVNIPDFAKCIAQFSGINISNLKDEVIKNYLITWARNKYRFFKLLNGKLRNDIQFEYKALKNENQTKYKELQMKFPIYALWLEYFTDYEANKIDAAWHLSYNAREILKNAFPDLKLEGTTITHLFKKYLQAPDDLITGIAAIYENRNVKATYTISIDPVDMMLASENPYDWSSCYRLELGNDCGHGDGCLAALLDTTSLITYVWNTEGKFDLYNKYKFKSIRYKRMRQWIAISDEFNAIHFNEIYPGKNYGDEFDRALRDLAETKVANYLQVENMWTHDTDCDCDRKYDYGYGEFHCRFIYRLKDSKDVYITVYDTPIKCPCGCGNVLPPSNTSDDYEEEFRYNGEGFTYENYYQRAWCEIGETYCEYATDCCRNNCSECSAWQQEHPICELDDYTECPDPDYDRINSYGIIRCDEERCCDCPLYAEHHRQEEEEEE